ncbi:MAG: flagellar hook-associated protein FlgK [Arcobacteraceae bacterium]
MLNILNVAQSGLQASQTQVENVMNNLANQTTEGYTKRVVNVSELEQSDSRKTGRGIGVDSVDRITDIYMYQNLIKASSTLSNINELNSMLADIESIFKETEDSGFSADLDRYFNSLENLRTSPQNEVYKNDVSNNAKAMVANLQTMYKNIEDVEKGTIQNINENVGEINNILKEIGNVSKQIVESTNGTPNDLLDKRDLLEKELSTYIDVEISREDLYELKIAGVTAVRFDTNVHEVTIIEEYNPQKDVYAAVDQNGVTLTDPIRDSLIPGTWDGAGNQAEIQQISISGEATSNSIQFLGSTIPTVIGDDASTVAGEIGTLSADIIEKWNQNNPNNTIQDIPVGSGSGISVTGSTITITYDDLEGDVPAIDNTDSNGLAFTGSIETTKGEVDSLTYTLNNEYSLSVTYGEEIFDAAGVPVDLDGFGNNKVDETNALQAMMYKINQSRDIGGVVQVYNGQYELAEDGSKILTNDPRHSDYDPLDPEKDRYLVIEAQVGGEKGSFTGEFLVNDSNTKSHQEINQLLSKDAIDDIHLEIYDKEISLAGGNLKAMLDNVKTDSGSNVFNDYKEKLDQFAYTLSNLTDSYIENADQSYIYGTDTVELSSDEDKKTVLNLFSGADVKSLKFNAASLNTLTQDKLDYLATIQWKEDVDFDGTDMNNSSFSQFYQTLRVNIADNKENAFFTQGAQSAVTESLQNAYDQVTKVDKDNEMVELIKYQSAYEANAKMITLVDEMLQTILNM